MPYANGAPIQWVADGLNVATGTGYYIVHTSGSATDMEPNVEYDIGHDNHPMIYLADAQYLPEWTVGYRINHYVEGYGYGFYPPPAGNYNVNLDYYADAISASDTRAHDGDYSLSWNNMYYAVSKSYSDFVV